MTFRRMGRLTAIVAVLGALALTTDRAEAALKLTLSNDGVTKVFYTNSNATLLSSSVGNVTLTLQITSTNFPGTSVEGIVTNSVQIIAWTPDVLMETFTSLVEVWNPSGDATYDGSPVEVSGATLATINALGAGVFTAPPGPPYTVTADVNATGAGLIALTAQNTTQVNDLEISSLVDLASASKENSMTGTATTGLPGYTMTQLLTMTATALTPFSSVPVQARSVVNAVPEPTTLLSALPLLMIGGGFYLRRRKAA